MLLNTNLAEQHTTNFITQSIKQGALAGLPIVFGYFPIAIAYGVLAKEAGLSLSEITMMSMFVFAGASQFMAAGMVLSSAGLIEIVIATFVVNFRHFVMSFSFMNHLRHISLKWKIPISLGLTDETFSVASLNKKKAKETNGMWFYAAMILVAYSAWVLGSLTGGLIGNIMPKALSQSMGVALYAMFIALLLPSIRSEWKVGLIAFISMLVNYICANHLGIKEGWSIVIATVLGGISGIFLLPEEEEEE
ncbi:branched-chain amino acid ABC transporter permease [Pontibacillus sp. HMF3514]|nr:branched-chain amino acid ABC transporter permease [Pontibacillus sp. HMF3514]